ncbi:MAG: cob(I)yrinic acid a,c-diamide adenosyltransferase [Alphaproteobacteria bacterium]|nr:cob(I)yrinic acid a,c-diamide adenosyltransferase [Alphaproteobacteria bacterium]
MVRITRVTTKTGDDGTTALGSGARVSKDDPRIAAYGTVDELNAVLGLARLKLGPPLDPMLARIQNELFDLGADLCVPEEAETRGTPLRIVEAQVEALERDLEALNGELSPLASFVLPGGSEAAALLHLARTVARRAEREMVALARTARLNPVALRYVNRLSDFLFVAARFANSGVGGDTLWVPGASR